MRAVRAPTAAVHCWIFDRADLLAAALAHASGTIGMDEAESAVGALERDGALHAVDMPGAEDTLATDRTVGEERETVARMHAEPPEFR